MQQAYDAVDEYIHRNNLETAAGLAEMYQDYSLLAISVYSCYNHFDIFGVSS